ncbi:glutaredoxin family protein [Pseudoxanthomonas sp. UTMC 1351]|uniref:glutaredoxin family protein n=1 Tax=Pseudoxanthomonas sp. UTMC 1351 TaxID=2695853 RepID=UPI0034CD660E
MRPIIWLLLLVASAGGIYAWHNASEDKLHPDDPRMRTGDRGVVMLAAEWCGYCRKQQKDFELAEVRYRVLDVDTEEGRRAATALGTRGVPVTVVGQRVIQGYDTAALQENLTPLGYDVY